MLRIVRCRPRTGPQLVILPLSVLRPTNERRGPVRLSTRAWTLLAVVAALIGLGFGGALGRWIAFALILAVGPTLIEPLTRLPWVADNRERLTRWLPLALLVVL